MAAEKGKEWDLKLLAVPNNHGPDFLVTYGEMNTLGDYFGSVEEMKASITRGCPSSSVGCARARCTS